MSQTLTDDGFMDEEWLAEPGRRSRLRVVLLLLLASSLVFFAGVKVQEKYGTSPAAASGLPAGIPSGVVPGALPGGTGTLGAGATSQADGGEDPAEAGSEAAVIGTVVAIKGDLWTVKDLGGRTHRITVSSSVRLTEERSISAADVKPGDTVDVTGTRSTKGDVKASAVTLR